MTRHIVYLSLAFALLLTGCQGSGVTTDYNPAADFAHYQRYHWVEETSGGDKAIGPFIPERVRAALQRQLDQGLYRPAPAEAKPDFLVRYYVSEAAQTRDSRARGGVGLGSSTGNVGMGVSLGFPIGGTTVTREVQVIIDVLDAESGRLAWRGMKRFELGKDSPEEITEKVEKVVKDIWSEYPPKRK